MRSLLVRKKVRKKVLKILKAEKIQYELQKSILRVRRIILIFPIYEALLNFDVI